MTGPRVLRWRRLHRLYAALFGYFWIACPLCGRWFGGHEWDYRSPLPAQIPKPGTTVGSGTAICPVCTSEGKGRWPEPRLLRFNLDEVDDDGHAKPE